MSGATLTAFGVYLLVVLAIGLAAYRRTRDLPDFILGGRALSGGVAALSAGASDMSGWLLLGLPGAIYSLGLNQIWIAFGLTVGAFANWQFVAVRLRCYTELAKDSLTLPDFLENRFHDGTRLLRVCSAVVILAFFTVYASAGLVAGAVLFEETFGLSYQTALWAGTAVIVGYTFLGGFLAVSWTDFAQGILMFIALIITPVVAAIELGGAGQTMNRIAEISPGLVDAFSNLGPLGIVSLMAWGLGNFGQPHILARFMAVRSPAELPFARLVAMWWMVPALYGALFTGFVAIAYFAATPLANPESAFIALVQALFNPWLAGCLLAAILAAIMSTVDSQLLVSSSALAEDLYKGLLRPGAGERQQLLVGRGGVVTIALVALFLARDPQSTVLGLVAYAWAGLGAGFGPTVLLSLFWSRMTRNGALAGMVSGGLTVVIWANLHGGVFDLYEILPAFVVSLAAITVVSLWDDRPSPTTLAEFRRVRNFASQR